MPVKQKHTFKHPVESLFSHECALTGRQLEILRWMGANKDNEDEDFGELVEDTTLVWYGDRTTNRNTLQTLLFLMLVRDVTTAPNARRYAINETGEKVLELLKDKAT